MKRYTPLACALLLAGCAAQEPEPVPLTTPVTTVAKPKPFAHLAEEVAGIEEATGTEVGISLFDGSVTTSSGSLEWLPAWSTMKVPIAMAAEEHCEYGEEYKMQLIEAAIEWSDNDSARALWDCMGSNSEASEKVSAEIAKSGSRVTVRGAFGTTLWSFAGQARYGYYLSHQDQDNQIFADMHHIAEDQAYGLGQLGIPFKGGWSDYESDGSWHTRQFGWMDVDGVSYGVAIGARSADGSYDDTQEALNQVAEVLKTSVPKTG